MRTNEIARKLGVSTQALSLWVKEFDQFFSDTAKMGRGRTYTADDLDVLATIAKASKVEGLGYDDIRVRLQEGEREHFEAVTLGIDSAMIAQSTSEALIDVAALHKELEYMRAERDRLAEEVSGKNELINQLYNQVGELRERAGKAEGRLEQLAKLEKQVEQLQQELQELRRKRRWFG